MGENDFYIFVHSDLDIWPLDLKFAPLIILVQRYVSAKLEVTMAFMFRENQLHGTDGLTATGGRGSTLNAAPREGHNSSTPA